MDPEVGDGPHCLDSLSIELSSEPANWERGIRQPRQMDAVDRSKPHPGSNCQEIGEIAPCYKSWTNSGARSEDRTRCQKSGGKCSGAWASTTAALWKYCPGSGPGRPCWPPRRGFEALTFDFIVDQHFLIVVSYPCTLSFSFSTFPKLHTLAILHFQQGIIWRLFMMKLSRYFSYSIAFILVVSLTACTLGRTASILFSKVSAFNRFLG